MEKTNPPIILGLLLYCCLLVLPTFGQQTDLVMKTPEMSLLDRLQREELPALEIELDIQKVFDDWKYQEYHKANATITTASGEEIIERKVEVRARGKFRSRFCASPPLKIKFKKSGLKKEGFNKWNEFKLVYPCKEGPGFQHYILKEYLVYKLLNELTDYSYRVQLISLQLVDETGTLPTHSSIGFMVEDLEELTDRLELKKEIVEGALPNELSSPDYTLLQVFQFCIGNTDWTLAPSRNLDMIKTEDDRLIPIPFDFDFAGIVNAEYASIDRGLVDKTVAGRFFMGHNKSMAELQPVFDLFREKENRFYEIIDDFQRLPQKERKKMRKYLQSFFKILSQPEKKLIKIFGQPLVEEGVSNY